MAVTDRGCPPGPGAGRGSAQGCPARGCWWRSGQRPASPPLQPTLLAAPAAQAPLPWGEDRMSLNSISSRLRAPSSKTQVFSGVSLLGCRLFLGCNIKEVQQLLLENMFPQNENTSLTKCYGDELSTVICCPSFVFKLLQTDSHSWHKWKPTAVWSVWKQSKSMWYALENGWLSCKWHKMSI